MGGRPPKMSSVLAAVGFSLSCVGLIIYIWFSFHGPAPLAPQGYRFNANFPAAPQLTLNNSVRISGITVGRVIKVKQSGLRTQAVMEIEHQYAPIPKDTRAILRSKTLLGETFVELSTGTRNGPKLPDHGTLSNRQIGTTQNVDEVLGAFDEPTRQAFKRFLLDFSAALKGRSADINDAIGHAGPATEDLTGVLELLDRQRPDLQRVIRDSGRTLSALGRREGDLQSLVTAGNDVLGATAARNVQLTQTVRALPPFLTQLRATLTTLEAASGDAAPALHRLRPVAPLVRPALAEAIKLAPQLQGLFRDLGPIIPAAKRGLPAATRIANATKPLSRALGPAGRDVVPAVELIGAYKHEIVNALASLGTATQATLPTGTQHYLRVLTPIINEGVYGYSSRAGSNRYNPYIAPGGVAQLGQAGLQAFDCRNSSNLTLIPPIGGSPPPCLVQQPWTFRAGTRSFPHLERAAP
jgi:phospholipid/cholesterol/gamma-HCH transport system substrate-binding protein